MLFSNNFLQKSLVLSRFYFKSRKNLTVPTQLRSTDG